MRSQARHDAVIVEIAYALLPSALLVVAAVAAGVSLARASGLSGPVWGAVGAAGLVVTVLAAAVRSALVLARARRRGL